MVAGMALAPQKTGAFEVSEPRAAAFGGAAETCPGEDQLVGGLSLAAFVIADL